jgi:hypothetical protein
MSRSIYHELLGVPQISKVESLDNSGYEYLLAVSSDSLYILSPDRKQIIESIVEGTDNDGYVVQADNEDDFLYAIVRIKKEILRGVNPLNSLF